MGEEGERCPLQGLVTLANPWNFTAGAHHLPSTFFGKHVYRYALGDALRALLHLHRRTFLAASNIPLTREQLEEIFRWRRMTLRQFDELIAAPMYGFKDAWDYYAQISSCRVIQGIKVPCLSINSIDDPITGPKSLPVREVSLSDSIILPMASHFICICLTSPCTVASCIIQVANSPYLMLAVTQAGGHLGWYERAQDGGIGRWYVKPVEQFLAALVEVGAIRHKGAI